MKQRSIIINRDLRIIKKFNENSTNINQESNKYSIKIQ